VCYVPRVRVAVALIVWLAACSKPDASVPVVETRTRATSAAPPLDAAPAVVVDAVVAVVVDASLTVDASSAREHEKHRGHSVGFTRSELDREAARFAELLESEGPPPTRDDMSMPRPGTGAITSVGGPGQTGQMGTAAPTRPTGRISVASNSSTHDTSLTAGVVLKKIQMSYMAGLTRCYNVALAKSPTLAGIVDLTFTIQESGRPIDPVCKGFDPSLDRCIAERVPTWRFPIPTQPDGTATRAGFSFRFKLVPG